MANYRAYKNRRADDKDYKKPHSEAALKDNLDSFISKWGLLAVDLAKQENVSCAAIHQRVYLYKNPFQRRKKPSRAEILHNKTEAELALEIDIHPQSIRRRIAEHNNAYYTNPAEVGNPNAGAIYSDTDWRDSDKIKFNQFWLHPAHPDYPASRGDKVIVI